MNKAKGTMSMKDVMESINKKNNMFKATSTVGSSTLVNATNPATATASGSTTTTTSSGEQPLENDVGQPAATASTTAAPSPAVTSATTTGQKKSIPKVRTPLTKRSPAMQLNDYVPGGGSLLKPLLATPTPTAKPAADLTKTEEPAAMLTNTLTTTSGSNPGATPTPTSTASTTSITVSSLDALSKTDAAETTSTTSVTASALANHVGGQDMVESINSKGRRRRDTDSSTKSDKSDISLLSVESGASSASNPTTKKQTGANKANTSAKARTAKGKYILIFVSKGRFYSEGAGKIWNLQSCEPNIVPEF